MVKAAGAHGLCSAALAEAAVGGKAGGGSGDEPSCRRPAQPPAATRADQRSVEIARRTGASSYRSYKQQRPGTLQSQCSGPALTGDWDATDIRLPCRKREEKRYPAASAAGDAGRNSPATSQPRGEQPRTVVFPKLEFI